MTTTEPRTAAANRARMRASEEKFATRLRERGWICIGPHHAIYDALYDTLKRDWFGIDDEEA